MRLTVALVLLMMACPSSDEGPASRPPEADGVPEAAAGAPTQDPGQAQPAEPEQPWDERDAFMAVFDALREGNWSAFAPFAGAQITYERAFSLGEEPPDRKTVAPEGAQAWLREEAATWAESCLERFEPPCATFNPLSLGDHDESGPGLTCTQGCCRHEPALLHNTPFLREVCFDDAHRVTRVSVIDG